MTSSPTRFMRESRRSRPTRMLGRPSLASPSRRRRGSRMADTKRGRNGTEAAGRRAGASSARRASASSGTGAGRRASRTSRVRWMPRRASTAAGAEPPRRSRSVSTPPARRRTLPGRSRADGRVRRQDVLDAMGDIAHGCAAHRVRRALERVHGAEKRGDFFILRCPRRLLEARIDRVITSRCSAASGAKYGTDSACSAKKRSRSAMSTSAAI